MLPLLDGVVKSPFAVIPAEAGVQSDLKWLDPRLRGDDKTTPSITYAALSFLRVIVFRRTGAGTLPPVSTRDKEIDDIKSHAV